jgi:hypothetical protein
MISIFALVSGESLITIQMRRDVAQKQVDIHRQKTEAALYDIVELEQTFAFTLHQDYLCRKGTAYNVYLGTHLPSPVRKHYHPALARLSRACHPGDIGRRRERDAERAA